MSEEAANSEAPDPIVAETAEATSESRPDWLLEKFSSAEDQAKAYSDLYGAYSRKTDKLRSEIEAEIQGNMSQAIGVPETIDGYLYPDGFDAPSEGIDTALKSWAKENNVSSDAFESLIGEVYAQTQPNLEAEAEKLGENFENRINSVNNWITKNINKQHFDQVHRLMTTAEGVEFFESMMEMTGSRGFAPEGGETRMPSGAMTREEIREMQADPRFGENPAYTEQVRDMWRRFANQG